MHEVDTQHNTHRGALLFFTGFLLVFSYLYKLTHKTLRRICLILNMT